MNLLESCKLANEKLVSLADAEKAKGVADNIRNRTSELGEVAESLVKTSVSAKVLLDAGILKSSLLVDDSKPKTYASEIREKVQTDASAITSGRTFTNLKKSVEKYASKTAEVVDKSWRDHVAEVAPKVDSKLLSQHRNTSHADTVARLERDAKEAKKIAKQVPLGPDALAHLKEMWAQIRIDLSSLPQADDPEVQAFLIAVGSETGAALNLLTKSVRDWLSKNKMLEDFSVRRLK